jgi:caa(3)-type oxidase subunit IV
MTEKHRGYLRVFLVLVALTLAELGLVYVPGIGRGALMGGLVLLALAKAGLVLLFFMHLHHETRTLKLTVILPFLVPALLALVLMGDAVWRLSS